MLLTDKIMVPVTARNINHYRDKGYDVPDKLGELIEVDINDLPDSSHVKISYKCDCCGNIFETEYHYWNRRKYPELGDLCKTCAVKIKLPKAMLDKYGFDNSANVQAIIDRKKKTNFEKYGTEWSIASASVRENIKDTMIDRYGVDNPMKSEEIRQKAIETMRERYGVDFAAQSKEVQEKREKTCMERYGVPCTAQSKEVREKMRAALYKNGTTPSSKAEKNMCLLLSEIYGNDNCIPNYPFSELSFDCLLMIGNVKIDVEYDGSYWHKNRGQIDAARNAVVMNAGYKVLRIKANSRDTLPNKEQIKEAVDCLVKGNRHLVFIDMNN